MPQDTFLVRINRTTYYYIYNLLDRTKVFLRGFADIVPEDTVAGLATKALAKLLPEWEQRVCQYQDAETQTDPFDTDLVLQAERERYIQDILSLNEHSNDLEERNLGLQFQIHLHRQYINDLIQGLQVPPSQAGSATPSPSEAESTEDIDQDPNYVEFDDPSDW